MSTIKQYNAKSGNEDQVVNWGAEGATIGDDQSGLGGTASVCFSEYTGTLAVKMTPETDAGTRACTISNVRLVCRIKRDSASVTDDNLFIYKWDESTKFKYDLGWHANYGSYTEQYYDWPTEPWGYSAWTWDLLDSLQWGALVYCSDAVSTWWADHTYILVTVEANKTGTGALTLVKPTVAALAQRTQKLTLPVPTIDCYGSIAVADNGIAIGNISSRLSTDLTYFVPIKIDIDEDTNDRVIATNYGQNQFTKIPANAKINLEFDALSDTTTASLESILNNRKYDKKLFLNWPADLKQVQDFYTRTGCMAVRYETMASLSPSLTPSGTELTSGQYNTITSINNTAFTSSGLSASNFMVVYMTFDLTAYRVFYSTNEIDRLTLFMHNPYCTINGKHSSYGVSVFDTGWNKWVKIGGQSLSISDADLRALYKRNQRFFSVRKTHDFDTIANFIDSDAFAYGNNSVTFAFYNEISDANYEIGFNYCALAINGYGVKQTNSINTTYRDPYVGSGWTGSIEFSEI